MMDKLLKLEKKTLCDQFRIDMGLIHDSLGLEYLMAIDALLETVILLQKNNDRIDEGFGEGNNWNVAWGNKGCPAFEKTNCRILRDYYGKVGKEIICKRNNCPIRVIGFTPGIFETEPERIEVD